MVAKFSTGVTALDMAAEHLSAASLNRGHRAILHRNQAMGCLIRRPKACEDLCQFYLDSCRIRSVRMRAHGALAVRWVKRLQQIEWRVGTG